MANRRPEQWIKHSARFSRFLADRGIIAFLIYLCSVLLGFLAVGFALVADHAGEWHKEFYANYPYFSLLLPPIVLPAVLWLVHKIFWGSGGSGIPQAIKVIKHPKPRITSRLLGPRAFLGKFILTPIVIAAGAAVGREGPTVQIGAALMAHARKHPGISKIFDTRSLIIAGGAAGVAAAFNTPLGGLMFAFEELGRRRSMKHTSTLLMAVVLAGLVALSIQGNYSYFGYSNATMDWRDQWHIILGVAVLSGIVGGIYGRSMLILVSNKGRIGAFRTTYPYRFAAICGVVISLMALIFGQQVFGAGYEETKQALQGTQALPDSFWITKMVSTVAAFASGVPGGVFSPTLSIGAGFGHFLAELLNMDVAPLMMLAMVGILSAVTHCPITSFVIVLEMIDNHGMVLPLILTSAISAQVSRRILPASIYHLLANSIRLSFAQDDTPQGRQSDKPAPAAPEVETPATEPSKQDKTQ
ncbi:MAG: chloride channel protein [Limnobacter sp.]|nr:chloride channel protein [Limnobacter sp.]